jgi:hypothetical protein
MQYSEHRKEKKMAIEDFDNLTEALSSDGLLDKPDGWFWKEVDTGIVYHRVKGEWRSWGLGLSFAPPTKSGILITDDDGLGEVAFGDPFVDDNYSVQLSCNLPQNGRSIVALIMNKDKNGFTLVTQEASRRSREVENVTVSWLATRSFNE